MSKPRKKDVGKDEKEARRALMGVWSAFLSDKITGEKLPPDEREQLLEIIRKTRRDLAHAIRLAEEKKEGGRKR